MDYKEGFVYAIIILVVCIMVYLPRRKQEQEMKKLQAQLKLGDEVITYSGLSGEIVELTEERVVLQTNPDKTKMTIEKWAVAGIEEKKKKDVE